MPTQNDPSNKQNQEQKDRNKQPPFRQENERGRQDDASKRDRESR